MSDFTTFLFARPTFMEGVARILDFAGSLNQYNSAPSPAEADRRAIQADWAAIGVDWRNAFDEFLQTFEEHGAKPSSE